MDASLTQPREARGLRLWTAAGENGDEMAILITGGAGYIGSVTVDRLRAMGEEVVVLDDLGRGHRSALQKDVPFYQGRVGDRAACDTHRVGAQDRSVHSFCCARLCG